MSDISRGPDYLARVLANTFDEDDVEPGEAPTSALEKHSTVFGDARAKAMARATRTKKPVKLVTTIVITDVVSFGSGDAARLETAVGIEVKTSKAPPIKARGAWLDDEGNQVGKVEKQTTIRGIDGDKATEAKAKRKAV